jgi:hypothetical protein
MHGPVLTASIYPEIKLSLSGFKKSNLSFDTLIFIISPAKS